MRPPESVERREPLFAWTVRLGSLREHGAPSIHTVGMTALSKALARVK